MKSNFKRPALFIATVLALIPMASIAQSLKPGTGDGGGDDLPTSGYYVDCNGKSSDGTRVSAHPEGLMEDLLHPDPEMGFQIFRHVDKDNYDLWHSKNVKGALEYKKNTFLLIYKSDDLTLTLEMKPQVEKERSSQPTVYPATLTTVPKFGGYKELPLLCEVTNWADRE